jgi:hypothetical protein
MYVRTCARWTGSTASTHFSSTTTASSNDQVDAITRIEGHALVDDGNRPLSGEPQSARRELVLQAGQIRGFEQAGTEGAMHLDRRADDLACDGVER